MNGIENITQKIISDAEQQANEMIAAAKQNAENIFAESKKSTQADVDSAMKTAEKKAADIIEKAQLAANLEGKRKTAAAMKAACAECFDEAFKRLLALPEKEYFDLLKKLANEVLSDEKGGELLLNKKDSAAFGKKLCEQFEGLTLASETPNIKGGLIIRRGRIEYNCTLEAIFRDISTDAAPVVSSILFKGA